MKYDKLSIFGLPKTFNLWDACDSFQPAGKVASPDDILFDMYPAECNEGEDASILFQYDESATGVELILLSICRHCPCGCPLGRLKPMCGYM